MIAIILIGLAAAFGGSAVLIISRTFSHRMDAIDHARDRAGLDDRISALELETGIRQMTDTEVRASERLGPNVVITDELREYARINWERARMRAALKSAEPTHR